MNSRAYQFQLEAAKAAVEAHPVHAVDGDALEPPTPNALLLELAEAQGIADAPPAPCQGNGVAPMGAGNAEPTKCPECPKWFASEKAMFGHLRKHPERGYKGAIRPATPSAAAAAAAAVALAGEKKSKKQEARKGADVSAMNMTAAAATVVVGGKKPREEADQLSTKWPVTAKRGRALEKGKQQASSCSEDEEAAMILLGLASSSHSTTSETQLESLQQAVHAPDAASGHQMPDIDHVAGNQTPPEAAQIVQHEIVLEVSAESQTPAVKEPAKNLEITTRAVLVVVPANKSTIAPSPGSSGAGTKKAKKRRAAPDLEQTAASSSLAPPEGADGKPAVWRIPSPASNKKHGCPTCGKSFSTYQALGGHMSSHVKGKAAARNDDLAAAQAMHNILAHRSLTGVFITAAGGSGATGWGLNLPVQDVQPPAPAVAQSPAPHVCSECHMTFPTGQALGGHKRKHWFPEKHQVNFKAAAPVEPAAPAPAPAPAEPAAPAVRDFDLNELPEEGEGENNQP